jgi:hypothetical protein
LCGERVTNPCTEFVKPTLQPKKTEPVPPWPRYEPVDLPPNCFADDVEDKPEPGRLPSRPATAVLRSSTIWTKE